MTVSRAGKHGTRAGTMRPSSRNGRVRTNARLKKLSGNNDDRPVGKRRCNEQRVIEIAMRVVGTRAGNGFVMADDVVSDILLALLDVGGFSWDEEEITRFCYSRSKFFVRSYMARQEKSECEFHFADDEGDYILPKFGGTAPALQPIVVDAHDAVKRVAALPDQHRKALEILCDGGNPIDVADELGVTPWLAIKLIKEAREWIDRVDPLDDAA